jgi:hypothetical protein
MSNDKRGVLKNNAKKCPHCGSTSTLPIAHGLIPDEVQQENAKDRKWVWGGCVIHVGGDTDHCNDCGKSFGGFNPPKEDSESILNEESFINNREILLNRLDEYLDGEVDKKLYAQALLEAEGDKIEAEHIYYDLFMQSTGDDEAK